MRDPILEISVGGEPEPQGSATAYVPTHPRTKQPYRRPNGSIVVNVTHDNTELMAWRRTVAHVAEEAWGKRAPLENLALALHVTFCVERPKGHWGTGRNAHLLKPGAPARPIVRPDADKLLRGIGDALSDAGVYANDAQITETWAEKRYAVPTIDGPGTGALIRLYVCELQRADALPPEQQVRYVAGVSPAPGQLAIA